jgi:diguanylate cyclase (GGDEF)-like protein
VRVPENALLLVIAAAAAVAYLLPATPGADAFVSVLLVAAPLLALAACMIAVRALPTAVEGPWVLFALAAAVGALGQFHGHAVQPLESWHFLANAAAMALFALGIGWILHQRDHERAFEIGLDAGLILAVATVVTLRWSPSARALVEGGPGLGMAEQVGILAGPIAAGCALIFGSVLLIVRGGSRAGISAAALAISAVAFALAMSPLAIEGGACCSADTPAGAAWIIAWLGLAYAAVRVRDLGADAFQPIGADAGGSRLRMVVAPAVAVTIAATVIDAAWHPPLQDATAVAIGLVGVLLALRMSQLLFATRSQSLERAQLAQSRALIDLSRALAGARRLDETLSVVTEWAVRLLNGRAAAIELLSADGTMLEFHALHGLPEEAKRLRFPVEGSFTGWVVTHGRARATSDPRTDPYIAAGSREHLGSSPMAAAPLCYRDVKLGALSCVRAEPFLPADLELLGALADQAAVAIESARLFEQVHQLSVTDPLTGLPNRRQLERDLAREFAAAQRGRRLVAIMFDLNGFKEYNDRFGHLAGDEALRLFANVLGGVMRTMNIAARYGGDEFIALLADSDVAGAEVFITRVQDGFPGPNATPRTALLSVAAGCAAYSPEMNAPEDLVEAADRALYERKMTRIPGTA